MIPEKTKKNMKEKGMRLKIGSDVRRKNAALI
jgi:hypothetical protein